MLRVPGGFILKHTVFPEPRSQHRLFSTTHFSTELGNGLVQSEPGPGKSLIAEAVWDEPG